jgi:hypothetical protein
MPEGVPLTDVTDLQLFILIVKIKKGCLSLGETPLYTHLQLENVAKGCINL